MIVPRVLTAAMVLAPALVSSIKLLSVNYYDEVSACNGEPTAYGFNGQADICRPESDGSSFFYDCETKYMTSYTDAECTTGASPSGAEVIGVCSADGSGSSNLECDEMANEDTVTIINGPECNGDGQLRSVDGSAPIALNRCYRFDISSIFIELEETTGVTVHFYSDSPSCDTEATDVSVVFGSCTDGASIGLSGFFEVAKTTSAPPTGNQVKLISQYSYGDSTDCSGEPSIDPNYQGDVCRTDVGASSVVFNCTTNELVSYSDTLCKDDPTVSTDVTIGECIPDDTTSSKYVCESYPKSDVVRFITASTCSDLNGLDGMPLAVNTCYRISALSSLRIMKSATITAIALNLYLSPQCSGEATTNVVLFDECNSIGQGVVYKISPFEATIPPSPGSTPPPSSTSPPSHTGFASGPAKVQTMIGWCVAIVSLLVIAL